MAKLYIEGGKRLSGETVIQGSKNSALPILAATLLIRGKSVIHNCPDLSDVRAAIRILTKLGCSCKREGSAIIVDAENVVCDTIPVDLMREMRSSVVFLGAILSRCGTATVSTPGGCELGPRPIDLHLKAIKDMGYKITEKCGYVTCAKDKTLKNRSVRLAFPSVGATENAILAACLLSGRTVIYGAAREPEIVDLADFLNTGGADIKGAGNDIIEIMGVGELKPCEHSVIPDRIVAATYMSAAAVTGGEVLIKNINTEHLTAIINTYTEAGCKIISDDNKLWLTARSPLKGLSMVKSMVYPGFPTDAGPTLVAMLTQAQGSSVFVENIFENRFKYIDELKRLGAKIRIQNKVAIIDGNSALTGANVQCTDLRGGAALVVAALAAEGKSEIDKICHIERGYEKIDIILNKLGAKIKRMD